MSVTFVVADMDAATKFYGNGLGLKAGPAIERPDVSEQPMAFPGGGAGIHLVRFKAAAKAQPAHGRAILAVADIAVVKVRLEGAGYALRGPITDVPQFHVRVGHVVDPDGNDLELVEMPH